jgi:hypothetical protein
MSHEITSQLFSAICPWLALVWCLQRIATWLRPQLRGWTQLMLIGVIAAAVLIVHTHGLAISRWVASLNANFSVPLTGMVAVAIWERAFARRVFSDREWRTSLSFGAIGGLVLYPLALGLGSLDPYEWGWRSSPLFIAMGVLTTWLIWKQNRFAFLLLLAVTAFQLRLLESTNYWDYLLDPIYWIVSCVAVVRLFSVDARRRLPQGAL